MKFLRKSAVVGALAIALGGIGAVGSAVPAEAYSGSTGHGCTKYAYARGGYASCIANIQKMLNGINVTYGNRYNGARLVVDNSFGPATQTQVKRFQSWAKLAPDGSVGPKTWQQLCFYAGQVNFNYERRGTTKKSAWMAAYDAGCYVEKAASSGRGYVTISRY